MIKKLLSLAALALAAFIPAGKVLAAVPASVSIVQLPTYTNTDNFEISYTANGGTSGLNQVAVEYRKDGQGWQSLGTFTDSARKVQVTPTQINQETKFYFRATATANDGSSAVSETSTTIDRTAPPAPESYSKEKVPSQTYRLRWFNPNNDDVYQVFIYRSDTPGFTANNGTLIAQINVTKNTESSWDNAVPSDRDYYYVLRGVDRAGNASDPKGDTVVVTETTTGATTGPGNGQPVSGNEQYPGQVLKASGSVLGEQAGNEPSSDESKTETGTEEAKLSGDQGTDGTPTETKNNIWPILGLGALGLGLYWFLFRR